MLSPIAAALILLILVVALRGVVAPLYLLVAVALEFAATLGAATLVVQELRGADAVAFTLPLVLFLFVGAPAAPAPADAGGRFRVPRYRRPRSAMESHDEKVGELGAAYARALLSGDEIAAEIAIREAMDANLTTAEIDDEIIAPALWFVGELWQRGEITVADEHLATEISIRVLALQREAQRVARARTDQRVLLAAPSGELHVVALRMTANLLREAGYDAVMLGPDVPAHALAASADRHRPDVVCLSATMPGGDKLLLAIHEIQQALPGARFVVGGRGVTARLRSRPGVEVCRRVTEVVEAVDAMVKRADQN